MLIRLDELKKLAGSVIFMKNLKKIILPFLELAIINKSLLGILKINIIYLLISCLIEIELFLKVMGQMAW